MENVILLIPIFITHKSVVR